MKINIKLKLSPSADPIEREVSAGTTIEELIDEYASQLPYRIITVRVDGVNLLPTHVLEKDCKLTLCDIRDVTAYRVFQRGLIMLYLKAVHDIYGDSASAIIHNSVNRGIFTTLKANDCAPDLRQIEDRMRKLVDSNLPIEYKEGNTYKIVEYTNTFYGALPASTGYIAPFALDAMHGGILLRLPHPSDPSKLAVYQSDAGIFDAYDKEKCFLSSLGLSFIKDLNHHIEADAAAEIIGMAELRQIVRIKTITHRIEEEGKRVILVAGPSSSGKTTFSKRIIDALAEHGGPEPLYLGTDDYFLDREFTPRDANGEYNFEGLDAMDVELFVRNIGELLSGKEADLPRYDFIDGKKHFGERRTKLEEGQRIVVEGIHGLNAKMSVGIDESTKFKVYISPLTQLNVDDHNRVPSTDARLIRRMVRDNRTRGRSVEETIRQWPKVREGESVNIFPYNNEADEVFNSTLVYELAVMKKHALPLLKEIKPDNIVYQYAKWMTRFLSVFASIEDESAIPANSIIREFIGGGKYYA